jgi:hypothetical protein
MWRREKRLHPPKLGEGVYVWRERGAGADPTRRGAGVCECARNPVSGLQAQNLNSAILRESRGENANARFILRNATMAGARDLGTRRSVSGGIPACKLQKVRHLEIAHKKRNPALLMRNYFSHSCANVNHQARVNSFCAITSGVTQKRPMRVTSKPANEKARDIDSGEGLRSLRQHDQCLERR